MITNRYFFALLTLFCLFSEAAAGQSQIEGTVTNMADGKAAPYVQVILYEMPSGEIVTFSDTDDDGHYLLNLGDKTGAFLLRTQSLTYAPYEQAIFIERNQNRTVSVNIHLKEQVNDLQEVIVTAEQPPIIVKEDTIIYGVSHWTDVSDESLEDVLRKMPGFEVQKDGEIKVNGKIVQKVIINGEEVSDNGAALITQSLSPENIKSVELRTNEQNQKYKNSLLDNNNFVILDIKLKEEVNTDIFGKLKATLGMQGKVKIGGYANVFSLNKKAKLHFIGEYDGFGEQTINLYTIKNIGQEALQRIFEVPADFKRLTENPQYDVELYGFRDYVRYDVSNAGLTAAIPLGNKMNLFVGTFNTFNKRETLLKNDIEFFNGRSPLSTSQTNSRMEFSTKNKVELRWDSDKVKAKYNINYVGNQFVGDSDNQGANSSYFFSGDNRNADFFHNLLFEFKPTKKTGFKIEALYNSNREQQNRILQYEDADYQMWFDSINSGLSSDNIRQIFDNRRVKALVNTSLQYVSKLGVSNWGLRYLYQKESIGKFAETNLDKTVHVLDDSPFSAVSAPLYYSQLLPYFSHSITVGNMFLKGKVGYGISTYPDKNYINRKKELLEIKAHLTYDFSEFDQLRINYSKQTSAFPLYALASGYDLLDYLTISSPTLKSLEPTPEITLTASFNTSIFYGWGIGLEFYNLLGKAENGHRYLSLGSPLIISNYDQLENRYFLSGVKIGKVFETLPITILLEPAYLKNISQNTDNEGALYPTYTDIRMFKMVINSDLPEKPYTFRFTTNYNEYRFANKYLTTEKDKISKMLSMKLTWSQRILVDKGLFYVDLRQVNFFGSAKGHNINMNAGLKIRLPKMDIGISAYNIFNKSFFIKEGIHPLYSSFSNRQLFSRYVKLGVQFKLD